MYASRLMNFILTDSMMLQIEACKDLSVTCWKCLVRAEKIAIELRSPKVELIHVLFALCMDSWTPSYHCMSHFGINAKSILRSHSLLSKRVRNPSGKEFGEPIINMDVDLDLSSEVIAMLFVARELATGQDSRYVGTEHVLVAIADTPLRHRFRSLKKLNSNRNDLLSFIHQLGFGSVSVDQ